MRAHQPGSTPIDIPETVPNPAYTPALAPAPERAPTKGPEKVPEKVIAPDHPGRSSFRRELVPIGRGWTSRKLRTRDRKWGGPGGLAKGA